MLRAGLRSGLLLAGVLSPGFGISAQQPEPDKQHLVDSGQVVVDSQNVPYRIRRLPVNAFPDLPEKIADQLNERGCLVPQTYTARHPENVVHASLEKAGSSDWAVLCSAEGTVSLLIFFASAPSHPVTLSSLPEEKRLQRHDASGVLGFNWGIDPASPEVVHQAQSAMEHRPPRLDHDALADSVVEGRTVYRFFSKGSWVLVDMPE
jgi:hypothetical protein